jgi:predicted regulator of amino acid metabolism with ACT domain
MSNEWEILSTALKHAAEIDRRTVPSLTESILRDWLARHGFLAPPEADVSGAAAINHNTAAAIA